MTKFEQHEIVPPFYTTETLAATLGLNKPAAYGLLQFLTAVELATIEGVYRTSNRGGGQKVFCLNDVRGKLDRLFADKGV